eukprot:m.13289 g.13289  ORF g.13289 m.13289 type:complete len:467 (-) comp4505_c0_seq2:193-1593(-)
MGDANSSWVMAPERGLDVPLGKEDGPDDEEATFSPELVSDVELRRSVPSSRYGKKVVIRKERPAKEEPKRSSFKPRLPKSDLRASAQSSSYGKKAIKSKQPKEAPIPAFKPKLNLTESQRSFRKQVVSSGYGVVVASPKEKKPPPRPSFRPNLPKDGVRERVQSSGYGRRAVENRPKTAPAQTSSSRRLSYEFSPRHTLAADRGKKSEPRPESPKFVLDCVAVGGRLGLPGQMARKPMLAKQLPPNDTAKKLRAAAQSSGYGIVSPAQRELPPEPEPEPYFKFSSKSVLDVPLEPFPLKTAMADEARSSQYGKVIPVQGVLPEPKQPEPRFVPVLKSHGIPAPPPVPKNVLDVPGHRYGEVSPEVIAREHKQPEPVWVPSKPGVGIPPPEPPPRSALNDEVQGHYGPGYSPERGVMETVSEQLRRNFTSFPEGQPPNMFHPTLNYEEEDEDGESYYEDSEAEEDDD